MTTRSRLALAVALVACLALAVAVPVAIAKRRAAERAEIRRLLAIAWDSPIAPEASADFEQLSPAGKLSGYLNEDGLILLVRELPRSGFVTFNFVHEIDILPTHFPYAVIWRDPQGELHSLHCYARDHAEARALAARSSP